MLGQECVLEIWMASNTPEEQLSEILEDNEVSKSVPQTEVNKLQHVFYPRAATSSNKCYESPVCASSNSGSVVSELINYHLCASRESRVLV